MHFSQNPSIQRFVPRVAATALQQEPYVWAVDAARAPDYWFPRDCPRAMAWTVATTGAADRDRIVGPGGGDRVHAVEYGWVAAIQACVLWAYRLPAQQFRPIGDPVPHAVVASVPVEPLGPPRRSATCWHSMTPPASSCAFFRACGRSGMR